MGIDKSYKISRISTSFILLIAAVAAQGGLAYSFILTHFYELKSSGFDGALFAQLLYNVINGHGMTTTIAPPYIEQSWLGVHFSPVIYVIAPIYRLFPHIETLLFLQSFLIAAAAIPIFFTAKILLQSQWQALAISVFYLLNPFVVNAQIWDFHEIAFAPLTISLILWSVAAKKRGWLIFFCAVLLTVKEHYGLAVFGTGILWACHFREPKFGLALSATGLISFLAVIKILMPYFNPMGVAAMMNENSALDYFSWLASPFKDTDLLAKIMSGAIFYAVSLVYYLWFLPVFSFIWLLPAIADGLVNALANKNTMMRHLLSYHSAAIIPVLLVAYTRTISAPYIKVIRLKRWEIIGITALTAGVFAYSFISLPYFPGNLWEFSTLRFSLSEKDKTARDEIIKIIGETAAVSAQSNILPHIPTRQFLYMFPARVEGAQYIVINTSQIFHNRSNVFGIPYDNIYFTTIWDMMKDKNLGIVFYKNNWLLFKRNGKTNKELMDAAQKDLQLLQEKFTALKRLEGE